MAPRRCARGVRRIVARAGVSEEHEVRLMVAYIGSASVVYTVIAGVLLVNTVP